MKIIKFNESIRDKMTPKSDDDVKIAIEKYFTDAIKDGSVVIKADFYFEIWEPLAIKYCVFDNFYAFNGKIFFVYMSTDEYENSNILQYTYESVDDFKIKLEKAIVKLNSL